MERITIKESQKLVPYTDDLINGTIEYFTITPSDEGDGWEKSNININNNILKINFREKFLFRRGRINCSLNDNGTWRWFGIQFSVKTN